MNKLAVATALATALNLLNDIQSEMSQDAQDAFNALVDSLPQTMLDGSDFANNGSLDASNIIKGK